MKFILPPTVNQAIGMLKGTALVSTVAVTDLLHSVQNIYNRTFDVVPMLLVACVWYFAIISVLDVAQRMLERRLNRGNATAVLTRRNRAARRASAAANDGGL